MKNYFTNLYKKIKTMFSYHKSKIVSAIKILAELSAIVSAILVLLTLKEMQIQRNNAYMPDIVFETVYANVSWGNIDALEKDMLDSETEYNPLTISIPTKNIGVGVAKQITYSIEPSIYKEWLDLLIELDTENEYLYEQKNNATIVKINGSTTQFNTVHKEDKVFLLANAEETYNFTLPMQYVKILEKIYSVKGAKHIEIPDLKIKVVFQDVQGVKYTKYVCLDVESVLIMDDGNGNGCATYKIIMK